jgi:endoglycosylceramidase
MRLRSGFAVMLLFATGCSQAESRPDGGSAVRLPFLHAEPDPAAGGRIVDSAGREVLLRGVNVNALAEYWKSTDFPTTFPLTESDVEQMSAIGWNAVRLLVSWSRVEPDPGKYDEDYLSEVDAAVTLFASRDIYSIIDFHQDAWGATLAADPGEACTPPETPAFGWDGAPGWATFDGGQRRCSSGIRELSPAVRAAWTAFWRDDPGPGGVGIRTRYAAMVGHVAGRYAGRGEVAGFDVMNEPNAFGPEENQALSDLYAAALAAVRDGENASVEKHLFFFEPSALWSSTGSGPPPDFARDQNVVYAPHIYTGGFTGGPITQSAFETAVTEAAGFGGAPVVTGEWGTSPGRASDVADGYFVAHQAFQDEFRIGATLWTWRESCGDPHHAGENRAGQLAYVWGEFEVDCTTNQVVGVREDLVQQLTRAYVRAAPGRLETSSDDPATGRFTARGTADGPMDFMAFYPAAWRGSPRMTVEGLSDARTIPAPGENVYLTGRSSGGAWSVTAVP